MMEHLTACTIIAVIAIAATVALRGRCAALRHAILLAALARFALPTGWLTNAGGLAARHLPARTPPLGTLGDFPLAQLRTPDAVLIRAAAGAGAMHPFVSAAGWLWAIGCALAFALWMRHLWGGAGCLRAPDDTELAALRAACRSLGIGDAIELRIAHSGHVPAAGGWWKPVVILPDGLAAELTAAELEAVAAHELAHVRRRDNLSGAIAHAIAAVFWFHPLVWWMERRMLLERELACDELVLGHGARAEDYIAAILKVCRMSFTGAVGYAGATGSHLKNRIEQIMSVNVSRTSSRSGWAAPGALAALAVLLPLAGGFLRAQPQVVSSDSAASDALMRQGTEQLRQKEYSAAEQTFRKLWAAEPDKSRGIMGVVETYMDQGRQDDAIRLLQSESGKNPARMDLRLALGNTAVRAGRYDLAIVQFQQAIDNGGQDAKAYGGLYLRLGETYRRKGDLSRAIDALRRAVDADPGNAVAYSVLALALDAAGSKQEAKSEYAKALKLDSNNGVAYNNLAYLLAENGGDLNTALQYAQKARQLLPQLLEAEDTLGWIYLKQSQKGKAVETFRDLVDKKPDNETYRKHLAMAEALPD